MHACSFRTGARRVSLILVFALCSLSLVGCVRQTFVRDPLGAVAKAGEGTVLVSITGNTGEVSQTDIITLKRVQAPGEKSMDHFYTLSNVAVGLSRDTSLFSGHLPAGEYRFATLHDQQTLKYLPINERQAELIGTFKVEPGTTTDLGRLVITAVNTGVSIGRSAKIPSNRELVTDHVPNYQRFYQAPVGTGWLVAEDPGHGEVERYAMAHPQGAAGFSELSTGEVIGGTRLGTVILRSKDGRWTSHARTGQLDAIVWTTPYEVDGHIAIASGELDTLILVDRDGSVKSVDTGDLPKGNIFFIDRSADDTQWIAGVSTAREAALYTSATLHAGRWTRMRGDNIQFSGWSGARLVWAWRRPGGVAYASSETRKIACYRYADRQWSEYDTPGGRKLSAVTVAGHDTIGVLSTPGGGLGGMFSNSYYSLDCGAHWTETKSPYKVKVMPPTVLPSGRVLESGGVFGDTGMYASRVGSTQWTKLTSRVAFNENVWVLPTAGLLAVSRGAFGFEVIQHSSDEGESWKVELSSFERRPFGGE